jgi:putative glutathione S-transferase
MLVNGVWQENWQPIQNKDEVGRFIRQTSSFRNWITPDGEPGITGEGGFKAEKGRYHLYVAYICPWASRTLMARSLKGLERYISISVVNPRLTDQGWRFGDYPEADRDLLYNVTYLHELYSFADADFTGRATVPVLWDKKKQTIVNNESADIVRMFNTAFEQLTDQDTDLYPVHLAEEIDQLNESMYQNLNNGVYQAGFATTQQAYEEAYTKVFAMLDELESRLGDDRNFLLGEQLTEADIRLFVTLIRFDTAYYSLFKCNRNTIKEMPYLHSYMRRVLKLGCLSETVNLDHIKAGYYSIKALNPNGIVPVGPAEL